jgi:PAS domain S-box-containing protein
MTVTLAALLSVGAILTATIATLLVQRRTLRKSEAFFGQLADDAPMMMWTTRQDATHDYLNKFSVEFTGMPLADLLNEGWQSAVHPDDLDRIIPIYVPAVAERQRVSMEYRLRRA